MGPGAASGAQLGASDRGAKPLNSLHQDWHLLLRYATRSTLSGQYLLIVRFVKQPVALGRRDWCDD